jgi:hypothetical protein
LNSNGSATKRKKRQMGLHEAEELLQQQKKWSPDGKGCPENGKMSLPVVHLTRDYNQNIQEHKKLNSPKINDPMKNWANEQNTVFSKGEVQMAEKYMKKCSLSQPIKETQIKTTLLHLPPLE